MHVYVDTMHFFDTEIILTVSFFETVLDVILHIKNCLLTQEIFTISTEELAQCPHDTDL
jgi:hypothetical protein